MDGLNFGREINAWRTGVYIYTATRRIFGVFGEVIG